MENRMRSYIGHEEDSEDVMIRKLHNKHWKHWGTVKPYLNSASTSRGALGKDGQYETAMILLTDWTRGD